MGLDASGNLYITSSYDSRVFRVDAATGILWRVAGPVEEVFQDHQGFTGDRGPALAARLAAPEGIAVTADGDLFIADVNSNRVRVVYACQEIHAAPLTSPSNGSSGLPTSPRLEWTPVDGAFRYDLYLDVVDPPLRRAAVDIETTTFSPANLAPLTRYYWKVVAKGDPFCDPFHEEGSEVWSFTTASTCDPPAM